MDDGKFKLNFGIHILVAHPKLTQLSVLKVKLADTHENGTRSNAATAPASLLFKTASDAADGGKSETDWDILLETIPLPTNIGAFNGP